MSRTTTVIVALVAAAGLSSVLVYAVPKQRVSAWGGDCCGGFGGFGGGFFGFPIFKHIQTTSQVSVCHGNGGDDNAQ